MIETIYTNAFGKEICGIRLDDLKVVDTPHGKVVVYNIYYNGHHKYTRAGFYSRTLKNDESQAIEGNAVPKEKQDDVSAIISKIQGYKKPIKFWGEKLD